jgi:RNA 2',3'-cyclic 3'-phosphodiesterase
VGNPDNTRVRLFYAAFPDAGSGQCLAAVAASMHLHPASRLVPRVNYHVTVVFVGEVPASQVPVLLQVGAAQRMPAFELRFDACEYWPTPKVVVAAARTIPTALEGLRQQLQRELAGHQWTPDVKAFRAHVTLARKVSQAPVLQAMSPFDWRVRDFCLVRSDTSGIQSAYTVVDTWPLLDDSEKT